MTDLPEPVVAIDVTATDGPGAGDGHRHHRPGIVPHAVLHAGGHPGHGAGRRPRTSNGSAPT